MRRHNSGSRARNHARDESGAILVLAMIFMVVVGLTVGALAAWTGNDLHNISNLRGVRSTLGTAEAAVQSQMTAMRFAYATTCPATPYTLNGTTVLVTCTTTANPASNASRVTSFTASPQSQPGTILVAAQVTFDDYSSSFNKNDCLASTPSPTTCGSGMTINSWVVNPGS